MEGLSLVVVLKILGDIIKLFPNYDQRDFNQYMRLIDEFEKQSVLPFNHKDYDDDYFANLKQQLQNAIVYQKKFIESQIKGK